MYPKKGANIAKDTLIIKLLIDNTVALLSDVVLIFISLRRIGVTIPRIMYIIKINNNPNKELLAPNIVNDISIAIDMINNSLFTFLYFI